MTLRGTINDNKKVDLLMSDLEITRLSDRHVRTLSGGEKKRMDFLKNLVCRGGVSLCLELICSILRSRNLLTQRG